MSFLSRLAILFFCLVFSIVSFANTKPVDGLRDYNGTYEGSPGTGNIAYSTLWRDNYDNGNLSGCNGEGCGKHYGVDIPMSSGTPVKASFSGTIVKATCDQNGFGNYIVIEVNNPYKSGKAYLVYAHLRAIYYYSGYITEGSVIGESGGGLNDSCRGNSTGSHLHFQVDKAFNGYPFFVNNVNIPDTNFEITQSTYNPVVFVTGGYNWTFESNGNYEYWTDINTSSSYVNSGLYWIDGNNDPYIWRNGLVGCGRSKPCSTEIAAEADMYKYVIVQLDTMCVYNPAKIYFKTSLDYTWSESKSISFNYGGPGTYWIYMGSNSNWSGIIRNLRIDPAVNCNPNASDPSYFYQIKLVN